MQAGATTIKLMADIADIQRKFAEVSKIANQTAGMVGKAFDSLGLKIGAALSVAGLAAWVRSAINAADEMSKLAQKTGVAVKDVAGLQLAFRQSGLEASALQAHMSRLSKAMTDGNRAIAAMGLSARNADGSLKSTRQMLGEVADKFSSYADGAAKTALAVELFGKAGADMIPLLNSGSEALDQFDAMALKLGLTLDKETAQQAERFNDTLDLMGQGMQGVGRQIAAQLLPTLSGLADQFFTSMAEGDRLARVAQFLGGILKGLYVVALGVVEIFNTLGKTLGGVAAIVVNVLRGNFTAAGDIARQLKDDLTGGWKDTLEQMTQAWNATGSASFEAMATATAQMNQQAPVIAANTKALEEKKKAEQEALKAAIAAARYANAQWDEEFKRIEEQRLATEKRIRDGREMLEQIKFDTRLLRMNNTERKVAIAMRELERKGIVEGTEAYEAFAKAIREAIANREAVKAAQEIRRRELDEWQKHWDQVSQSFVDALMQGGKSVAEYLKSLFRTLVLRPILAPIGGAFASVFGGPSFAGDLLGGGATGSTFNILSAAKSAYDAISTGFASLGNSVAFAADRMGAWLVNNTSGVLNQMGGSLMQSAGSLGTAASYLGGAAAGLALGSVISGGYSAIGRSGNTANIAGTAIGAIFGGPIGAAIGGAIGGSFNRAFGRKAPVTTGTGISGTLSTTGANVRQFQDWHQRGGWFRSGRGGTNYSPVRTELGQFLDGAVQQIAGATRAYAGILGLNADAINGITQTVRISLQGLNPEQQQQAIMAAMQGFADRLAQVYANPFVRAGETAGAALARLGSSLATVNQVFDTLNHTLMAVSLAGGDAASKLLDAFGGAEAFVQATSAFYDAFYTEAERTATATRQLTKALAGMGMTLPATRDAYRALVEAQDLNTKAGRQAYVTLLRLAPAFAKVTDAAGELAGLLGRTVAAAATEAISLIDRQIKQSREAASAARDVARAYRDAAAGLSATMRSLIFDTHADQGAGMAYASALSAARGGDVEAMRALPNLARAYAAQATELATSRAQATLISAQIAAQLGQVAAVAEVMGLGADYQAMLYDVNTAILDVLRTDLQTGDLTVSRLTEIRDALGVVGSLISSSGSLTVAAVQTMDGRTVGALVDTSGRVVAQVSNSTVQTLAGLTSHGASLGGGFATSISGQTAQFGQFTNQQNAGLASIDGGVSETVALTDIVAQTSGTNSRLSEAILRQLQTPDVGSRHLSDIIAAGNTLLAGRVDGVIAAINRQSAAQQAELKRQQDLALAQGELESYARFASSRYAVIRAAAPTHDTPGGTNDAAWENIVRRQWDAHRARFGIGWNTWFTRPHERAANLANMQDQWAAHRMAQEQPAINQQIELLRQRVRDFGGVPAFATGGLHAGGLRLVGEHGPELEATGPSRIYSASQTAAILGGGGDVAQEVRALREELGLLRAEARATASNTGKTKRLLERVTRDGEAMQTVGAAP